MKDKKKSKPKTTAAKAEKKPSIKKQLTAQISAQILGLVTETLSGEQLTKSGVPKGVKLKKIVAKAGKSIVKQLRQAAKDARKASKETKPGKQEAAIKKTAIQPQTKSLPVKAAAESKPKSVRAPRTKTTASTAKVENVLKESAS